MGKYRGNPNAILVLLSFYCSRLLRTVFDTQCVRRCLNAYFYPLFIFPMRFKQFSMRNYAFTRLICSYETSSGRVMAVSDWEGKGPCAIVPFIWKMAHQSLCRLLRNGPLKISKSLKKAEMAHWQKSLPYHWAVSGALPLVLELREESHLPFFILSRLRKVSYLAVSVRLTVKQVRVNECVVQYDWSMIFKGPIKWCNT